MDRSIKQTYPSLLSPKINKIKGWNEDENEKDDFENNNNGQKKKENNLPKEEQQPPTTENKTNTNIANLDSLLDD